MNKITLIIVDFQKDFSNSVGKLYVKGSASARKAIISWIKKHINEIGEVIFTIDWHPINHCSFKKNGGIWPNHCIQYSEGAGIDDQIMHTCIDLNIPIKFFLKGNDYSTEEYGAFEKIGVAPGANRYFICANNHNGDSYVVIDNLNLVVCGIAGDYCVLNTIKNLQNFKAPDNAMFNVKVLMDGIASIDDGTTLKNYINKEKLEIA